MTETHFVHEHKMDFFIYLHSKFTIFHHSNVFYRDIRYALKSYMLSNGFKLSEMELDAAVDTFIVEMAESGILKMVSTGTWTVQYPEFQTKKSGKPVR